MLDDTAASLYLNWVRFPHQRQQHALMRVIDTVQFPVSMPQLHTPQLRMPQLHTPLFRTTQFRWVLRVMRRLTEASAPL